MTKAHHVHAYEDFGPAAVPTVYCTGCRKIYPRVRYGRYMEDATMTDQPAAQTPPLDLEAIKARNAPFLIDQIRHPDGELLWPDEGHREEEFTMIQQDIPALIAEVERLRDQLAAIETVLDLLHGLGADGTALLSPLKRQRH